MANKLFSLPKPKPNLQRNGFDKSRRSTFSIRLGELLPVFCEETIPDSYYEIKPSNYIQTLPLFTNSFTRLKQNLDFYFVPYTALWSKFNQFYEGRPYITQSNQTGGSDFAPCFKLGDLLTNLSVIDQLDLGQPDTGVTDRWHGFYQSDIIEVVAGTCKLLDMLGYGAYYSLFRHSHFGRVAEHTGQQSNYNIQLLANHTFSQYPNLFRLAAYQCVWNAFYRNRYWDLNDYNRAYNFDDLLNGSIAQSNILAARSADFTTTTWASSGWGNNNYFNPFILRYRGYKKDRFTGLFPYPQFGDLSVVNVTNFKTDYTDSNARTLLLQNGDIKKSGYNSTKYAAATSGGSPTSAFYAIGTTGTSDVAFTGSFDVYALRKAEMLQKWRETQLRAGNVTADQQNAVFGVLPKFERDLSPVYLGSYDSPIKISEVISTANTSSPEDVGFESYSNLGERAGKADSSLDGTENKIEFKASDFGIIIGVMSIVPENEYNSVMIDDANTYSVKEDFFNPFWENLGFREVPLYSLFNIDVMNDGATSGTYASLSGHQRNFNTILGYVPPYIGYKTAIDKVHGRFLSKWSNLFSYDVNAGIVESNENSTYGDYYFYNSPRNDLQFSYDGSISSILQYPRLFYINPSLMKPVFVDQDEEENFLVCQYCDVKSVQPMTELGLPRW